MFSATFLGHHGWLVASARSRILIDPILVARWGLTDAVGLCVYPPRVVEVARFPALDAVFITHEHEGHFEIPSLHLIDRRVPVYVSARSSSSLDCLLREMGFGVYPVEPGDSFSVGDLRVHTMAGDHLAAVGSDEWDVLPFVAYDEGGHGSLFNHVDTAPIPAMWQAASEVVHTPGLFVHTTNANDWSFELSWAPAPDRDLEGTVRDYARDQQSVADAWGIPACVLIAGQGYGFTDDRAWLDARVVPYDTSTVAEALQALVPHVTVIAPAPGATFTMIDSKLVSIADETPFLRSLPRDAWPLRGSDERGWLEEFSPATGRTVATAEELTALGGELQALARHMHGGPQFREVYGLTHDDAKGREPTVAIVARSGDGAFVFAYEPQGCRFVATEVADPAGHYLAVFECWATDLLALLRAEVSANTLLFGRSRMWNANPSAFGLTLPGDLLLYAHPLRHPERFLALYRSVHAAQPEAPVRIAFAGASQCSA